MPNPSPFRLSPSIFYLDRAAAALPRHPSVVSFNAPAGRPMAKIMATWGPASDSPAEIEAMIQAGADYIRINDSHNSTDEHRVAAIKAVLWARAAACRLGREVGCVIDLKGAEFRTSCDEPFEVVSGEEVLISTRPGSSHRRADGQAVIHIRTPAGYDLISDIRGSQSPDEVPTITIADGTIQIQLKGWPNIFSEDHPGTDFFGRVVDGGKVENNKGTNFPQFDLQGLPDLVPADIETLDWAFSDRLFEEAIRAIPPGELPPAEMLAAARAAGIWKVFGFDYVAASFTRTPRNVVGLTGELDRLGALHVQLHLKPETRAPFAGETLRKLVRLPRVASIWHPRGDAAQNLGDVNAPSAGRKLVCVAREEAVQSTLATGVGGSLLSGGKRGLSRAEYDALYGDLALGFHMFMLSDETARPLALRPSEVVALLAQSAAFATMEPEIARSDTRRLQQEQAGRIWDRRGGAALQTAASRGTQTPEEARKLRDFRFSEVVADVLRMEQHAAVDGIVLWSHSGGSMRAAASVLPSKRVYLVTDVPAVAREAAGLRGFFPILVDRTPRSGAEVEEIARSVLTPTSGDRLMFRLIENLS